MAGTAVSTGAVPLAIGVVNGHLVTSDATGGGRVFSVAAPAAPAQVGSFSGSTAFVFAAVGNTLVFPVSGASEIKQYDLSVAASPSALTAFTLNSRGMALAAQGAYIYAIEQTNDKLSVFSTQGSQPVVGTIDLAANVTAGGLLVVGDKIYFGGLSSVVRVYKHAHGTP